MPRSQLLTGFVAMAACAAVIVSAVFSATPTVRAGQAPYPASAPDIPITNHDRVYAAEQYSNTVSVTDPSTNTLLGEIALGEPAPGYFSPLYIGQVLVHGMGFSPDNKTLVVVSIGSNSATFIDTATNAVKHTTYVGRSPHEAFFTPDGKEVWVAVRGENYVSVLDGTTYEEKTRITVPNGPGMQIFSPDGTYGYVCSSFTPETVVVRVADHQIVGHVPQASPFCPNIAATPDGSQVWFTLKDSGKVQVFDAHPPFELLQTIDTGPITNHVNIVRNANGQFAYVTIGGLDVVKVFRTADFSQVATIPVGKLPHGIWPSGDGSRVYTALESSDELVGIDTLSNSVIATIPIGQSAQAVVFVPSAAPNGDATQGLQPLGLAGQAVHLTLKSAAGSPQGLQAPTSVALYDQGVLQMLEAAVTGLQPTQPYVIGLAEQPDGGGTFEPLADFMSNLAGAQVVNALGPIREIVRGEDQVQRRYLAIRAGSGAQPGALEQIQAS
jgi:YVTN family beta-propeller protein